MKCIEKCKTGIAIFLLGVIILSVFPAISQASNTYTFDGCRTNSSYGYRSYTKATGYDSNGYAVNVGVRAYFILNGDDVNTTNKIASKIKYGKGEVSVFSEYESRRLNAAHTYCHGLNLTVDFYSWKKN